LALYIPFYEKFHIKNAFISFLEIDPIGLISAEEQSYFVKYPLNPSSKFEEPNTNKKPYLFNPHVDNYPIIKAKTILDLAYIFYKAISSAVEELN
jgi:hypothetical protein